MKKKLALLLITTTILSSYLSYGAAPSDSSLLYTTYRRAETGRRAYQALVFADNVQDYLQSLSIIGRPQDVLKEFIEAASNYMQRDEKEIKEEDALEIIRTLQNRGANINHTYTVYDRIAATPIMLAAATLVPSIVKALIELGADVTIKDQNGETALDQINNYAAQAAKTDKERRNLESIKNMLEQAAQDQKLQL